MRQRSTWDETKVFPTTTPPLTVDPGEVIDYPTLLPGFVAEGEGPEVDADEHEVVEVPEPAAELPPPHLPGPTLLGGLTLAPQG
jgi:hypothetical protein